MGYPIQRIAKTEADPQRRAADRALLLTRIAVGLAHDGKNPLHNMVLHLQLMAEKLGSAPVEKHLAAMRDGIGRVDSLLKAFGEFAAPDYLPPDLAAAAQRAVQLFAHDARRASVQLSIKAPGALLVQSESMLLGDLVAHALVACIESAHDGRVDLLVEPRGAVAVLEARAAGESESREQALPHLDAARRLAADAACELSITAPTEGGARLSLSFLHPR
jgi:hypothetical protein